MIQAKGNKYKDGCVQTPSHQMKKVPTSAARSTIPKMFLVILTLVQLVTAAPRRRELILRAEREELAKQWAPIVWLHPNEHFYPSSVIHFLQHIKPSKPGSGNFLTISDGDSQITLPPLPEGRSSWDAYLLASYNSECHNCSLPKFLYGKKPGTNHSPPLYAVIHSCAFQEQKTNLSTDLFTNHQGFLNDDSNTEHQSSLNSDFMRKHDSPSTLNGSQSDNLGNITEPQISLASTIQTYTITSPNHTKYDNHWHPLSLLQNLLSHSNYSKNQVQTLNSTNINMYEKNTSVNISLNQNFLKSNQTNFQIASSNSETALTTKILPELKHAAASEINNSSQFMTDITNDSEMLPIINIQNDQDAHSQQNANPRKRGKWPQNDDDDDDDDDDDQRNANSHKTYIKDKKRDVVNDSNQLFTVTYWMFYAYNYAKDVCTANLGFFGRILKLTIHGVCHGETIAMGNHIGDWEHITIQFKGRTPTKMYVSSHDFGAYYAYDPHHDVFHYTSQDIREGMPLSPQYPSILQLQGTHPILFAAQGSHGLWTTPGIQEYNKFPSLEDKTGEGTAWNTWENLEIIDLQHQDALTPDQRHWLSYEGHWGNPSSNCHPLMGGFCEKNHGPTGIPRKRINFPCQR